ncbi:hypothetical protein PCASD_26244 [Puccinia coronata f. sp. avenae]|uniref:Uncharacterized protein n=1 Tax=Puccinia coronata f. sp. avenae TaxID=200324 RepID=A0A2N5RZA0_9BASI|nr:hypothetical protein PCASD_26244 [Puccinia coronata f. sp. avenae]
MTHRARLCSVRPPRTPCLFSACTTHSARPRSSQPSRARLLPQLGPAQALRQPRTASINLGPRQPPPSPFLQPACFASWDLHLGYNLHPLAQPDLPDLHTHQHLLQPGPSQSLCQTILCKQAPIGPTKLTARHHGKDLPP